MTNGTMNRPRIREEAPSVPRQAEKPQNDKAPKGNGFSEQDRDTFKKAFGFDRHVHGPAAPMCRVAVIRVLQGHATEFFLHSEARKALAKKYEGENLEKIDFKTATTDLIAMEITLKGREIAEQEWQSCMNAAKAVKIDLPSDEIEGYRRQSVATPPVADPSTVVVTPRPGFGAGVGNE